MSHMVFRLGDAEKWKGVGYDWKNVSEEELQEHLDAGWFAHPDDLLKPAEPEPEPTQCKKPGPKPKADNDADSNEG
ncbi:hypothetical protein RRQ98_004230 [Klebsiella pneumoniae]|nr:hypothetical protein [Klebsiella pneumoniae]